MKVAVTDANIFIDLLAASLLDVFASLDLEILTSYEVFSELYPEHQALLSALIEEGKLIISLVDSISFDAWKSTHNPSNSLSYPDQTVLFLAVQYGAIILSGEKLIRKFAERLGIEVHGILWILDQLVEKAVIGHGAAHDSLTSIMKRNKWLPLEECNLRLANWSTSD